MRYVRITLLALLAGEVLLLAVTGGWRLGADGIEYAPAVPPGARPAGPPPSPHPTRGGPIAPPPPAAAPAATGTMPRRMICS